MHDLIDGPPRSTGAAASVSRLGIGLAKGDRRNDLHPVRNVKCDSDRFGRTEGPEEERAEPFVLSGEYSDSLLLPVIFNGREFRYEMPLLDRCMLYI